MKNRREFIKSIGMGAAALYASNPVRLFSKENWENRPNVVLILADDLGYGDIQAYNKDSKIPTPNIDFLAENGISYTDAHSNSAVCTPTRYGLLTGRYAWRSRLKSGVLTGFSPHLIEKGRETIASLLKKKGYETACIGKWHLGWDWQTKSGNPFTDSWNETGEDADYSQPILNGPTEFGFDYFYGISGSLDMTPYVYVENDRVTEMPDNEIEKSEGTAFFREGPIAPDFHHEEVLPHLTDKAVSFINQYSQKEKPFFLYFPLTAPHTPILPGKEFQGKTGIGAYGDFVCQCDYTVGQVINALKKKNILDNTIILFTSDNGCSPMAGIKELEEQGHYPSYIYRGYKADIYEGGHRIPFIAHWPEKIKKSMIYDETVCLTDIFATMADISDSKIEENAGEDSFSLLSTFSGDKEPVREGTVHHSVNGSFSIRKGDWKLELCPGSGGWSEPIPEKAAVLGLPFLQLYNMKKDPAETENLQDQYPEVCKSMLRLLEDYVKNGRSTAGKPVKNTTEVNIWEVKEELQNVEKPELVKHFGFGGSIQLLSSGKIKYAEKGINALIDGIKGSSSYKDGLWAGLEDNDLEVIIDLKSERELHNIQCHFMEDQKAWIFLPSEIVISIAASPEDFLFSKEIINSDLKRNDEPLIKKFSASFSGEKGRYIKITAKNPGPCPEWHPGKGGKTWIFTDEIIIQ